MKHFHPKYHRTPATESGEWTLSLLMVISRSNNEVKRQYIKETTVNIDNNYEKQ